jgi:hypothetical protein
MSGPGRPRQMHPIQEHRRAQPQTPLARTGLDLAVHVVMLWGHDRLAGQEHRCMNSPAESESGTSAML